MKMHSQKVHLGERIVEKATPREMQTVLNGLAEDVKKLGDAHDAHDDSLVEAFRGGLSTANNNLVQYRQVSIDMPPDAPWVSVAASQFTNSWDNYVGSYAPAGYLMEPGGRASMRGVLGSGTPGMAAFQLPTGFGHATYDAILPAATDGDYGYLTLAANGAVAPVGDGTFWSLASTWVAAPAAAPFSFPSPWPIVVQHGWQRCFGLIVEACREETSGSRSMAGAPVADWEDVGNGQLRLNGIWGLQWGKRYSLRLRLSAEEI